MTFNESFITKETNDKQEAIVEALEWFQQEEKEIYQDIDNKELASNENTEAISLEYINNREKTDKQKIQEIQEFNTILKNIVEKWEKTIIKWPYKVQTKFGFWDWGSRWDISFVKNNKEVFSYHYSFEEGRIPREVWVVMKIDWKLLSYNTNNNDNKWTYNNYTALTQAKIYKKEIDKLLYPNTQQKKVGKK